MEYWEKGKKEIWERGMMVYYYSSIPFFHL